MQENHSDTACKGHLRSVQDTMELLSGKWKIYIISALIFSDKQRFSELQRNLPGIGSKMLSKELQELELNQLITREVLHTKPITVEYSITDYGKTLGPVIGEIGKWGAEHRNKLFPKTEKANS